MHFLGNLHDWSGVFKKLCDRNSFPFYGNNSSRQIQNWEKPKRRSSHSDPLQPFPIQFFQQALTTQLWPSSSSINSRKKVLPPATVVELAVHRRHQPHSGELLLISSCSLLVCLVESDRRQFYSGFLFKPATSTCFPSAGKQSSPPSRCCSL